MAVVKIKTIKNNLQAVLNYGKNGDKTDNGVLVSSVNCSVNTAYEEMALTKKFFHNPSFLFPYGNNLAIPPFNYMNIHFFFKWSVFLYGIQIL